MFKKLLSALIVNLVLFQLVIAQSSSKASLSRQFSINTDNDIYTLTGSDGYYTNGISLGFSKLGKNKTGNNVKTIYNYELGHKIFTAGIREVYVVAEIDRPITGYLYGKFSVNKFKPKNKVFGYGVSIGTIGKNGLGEQLLKMYHPLIKINSDWWDWIWQYQLKSEVGVNLHGSFAKGLINHNTLPFLQVTPKTEATLGTTFSNISQAVVIQVGKQNQTDESSYWGSALGNAEAAGKKEIFLFYAPAFSYQVYNATVQGGMFTSDKNAITSDIEPFMLVHELGVMGSIERLSASFRLFFQTREAKLQENKHSFGRIQLDYRF